MPTVVEKLSIALPAEMAKTVRDAVEAGEYASNSEVVREALRDWNHKRARLQQEIGELRRMWNEAVNDPRPSLPMGDVLDRLERKYRAMAEKAGDAT